MASIVLTADNDGPPSLRATTVAVSGEGFAPGTAVNIGVLQEAHHAVGHARVVVEADGTFAWADLIRPKLACERSVRAVVHDAKGEAFSAVAALFCPPTPLTAR